MTIYVYNTLTNQKEEFEPITPGQVKIYACGVTVYDVSHVGHAMQAIIYDVIRNYLEFKGFDVTYVRNYTDVDDKIIARARELGLPALDHAEHMIKACQRDLEALDVQPADHEPRVSEHMQDIIDLIQKLIDRGHAYEVSGDVYFHVRSFPQYGRLSNSKIEDLLAGTREEVNTRKRDPLDFALWKSAKPGEVHWPSPWGQGRPGWHIECSALSQLFLGETFDIHGGGKDLIFPHHENEIAQSQAATGAGFARYWMHNGLITVDGRKMSKSFNNFLSIEDAVKQYDPETIRFAILSHHYSTDIDFSEKTFYDAYHRLIYFYTTLQRIDELFAQITDFDQSIPDGIDPPQIESLFVQAMDDDFNTALALAHIGSAFRFVNDLLAAKKPKMKRKMYVIRRVVEEIVKCARVLGFLKRAPEDALAQMQHYLIKAKGVDTEAVTHLVAERDAARLQRNWDEADRIRDQLLEMGIQVRDTPNGTQWHVTP